MKQRLHVRQRTDGYSAFADLSARQFMVGVVAHQGRQIEGDRNAVLSLGEQIAEARVRLLGGAEAGELAHGPKTGAVHGWVDAPRVRRLAGSADGGAVIREVGGRIAPADRIAGNGSELRGAFAGSVIPWRFGGFFWR